MRMRTWLSTIMICEYQKETFGVESHLEIGIPKQCDVITLPKVVLVY